MAPGAARIGPAMSDPVGHDVDQLLAIGLLVTPGYSAHISPQPARGPAAQQWQGVPFALLTARAAARTPAGTRRADGSRRAPPRRARGPACPPTPCSTGHR